MKKIIAILVATLTLGMASPSNAAYNSSMVTWMNMVNINKVYAEQILYCDSNLKFTSYNNAIFFDNNGSCIDPSALIFGGGDIGQWIADNYPGGMNQWTVYSESGRSCEFKVIQLHPHVNEYLVWDTFFTACSVRLNEDVNVNWVMRDNGNVESPVFTACSSPDLVGMYDNCLDTGMKPQPGNSTNMLPGTVDYINGAAKILKKKFFFDFKAWLTYNKKLKKLRFTMSQSPAGTKFYLQKWVDYKWITVKTVERLWENKTFSDYTLTSSGKYRIMARSITGKVWKSRPITV